MSDESTTRRCLFICAFATYLLGTPTGANAVTETANAATVARVLAEKVFMMIPFSRALVEARWRRLLQGATLYSEEQESLLATAALEKDDDDDFLCDETSRKNASAGEKEKASCLFCVINMSALITQREGEGGVVGEEEEHLSCVARV